MLSLKEPSKQNGKGDATNLYIGAGMVGRGKFNVLKPRLLVEWFATPSYRNPMAVCVDTHGKYNYLRLSLARHAERRVVGSRWSKLWAVGWPTGFVGLILGPTGTT